MGERGYSAVSDSIQCGLEHTLNKPYSFGLHDPQGLHKVSKFFDFKFLYVAVMCTVVFKTVYYSKQPK